MSACAHVDDVEDLAVGMLEGPARERASRHLAACEECRAAYDAMRAECSLFEARAPLVAAPPDVSAVAFAAALDAVPANDVERGALARLSTVGARLRRDGLAARGLVAALACAAAIAGVVRTAGDASPLPLAEAATPRAEAQAYDEPLACAFPACGLSSAPRGDDALACVASSRTLSCEEEVTSKAATP